MWWFWVPELILSFCDKSFCQNIGLDDEVYKKDHDSDVYESVQALSWVYVVLDGEVEGGP